MSKTLRRRIARDISSRFVRGTFLSLIVQNQSETRLTDSCARSPCGWSRTHTGVQQLSKVIHRDLKTKQEDVKKTSFWVPVCTPEAKNTAIEKVKERCDWQFPEWEAGLIQGGLVCSTCCPVESDGSSRSAVNILDTPRVGDLGRWVWKEGKDNTTCGH